MCDIIALAFQTDRTRIATMLLTNNLSGQVYPFLGLRDDHHSFSHSWQGKEFASITRFWVEQYAYLREQAGLDAGRRRHGARQLLHHAGQRTMDGPQRPEGAAADGRRPGRRARDRPQPRFRKRQRAQDVELASKLMERMGVALPQFGDANEPLAI